MAIYSSDTSTWTTWTSTATTSSSTDSTWVYWAAVSATTSADTTWSYWSGNNSSGSVVYQQPKPPSKAEIARMEAARVKAEAKAKEEQKKRDEAIEKSRQLLVGLLDKNQAEQLEKKGEFGFVGPSGALYTIRKGIAGNITMAKEGKRTTLCCHTKDNVPVYDNMASQLIWLKFCEEEFVNLANKTHL